jgi:hypothetical protein
LPKNHRANIYMFLWVGQKTKLPLKLEMKYTPLRLCAAPSTNKLCDATTSATCAHEFHVGDLVLR